MTRLVLLTGLGLAAAAQLPRAPDPAPVPDRPWFVDDEQFFDQFTRGLIRLAKDGKCLAHEKFSGKVTPGRRAAVTPVEPGDTPLSPEEVYARALPSVFVVGSVYKDNTGDWVDGVYATAWVAAADGVLVTNWHVFEDLKPGEVFGVADHKGNVYPVTDFLGGDKTADVAVFRTDARGLKPLPVATGYPPVGAWVGVLSHPGDNFYVFTTGNVTRYSTNANPDGKRERWMGLTAEFAGGSSGAPVLNRYGAVVGMAALTLTIDDGGGAVAPAPDRRRALVGRFRRTATTRPHDDPETAPPPREKPDPAPEFRPVLTEMVLKMAVPAPTIRKSFGKGGR
jgi:S1-C subfamily serine protease